jgi:hypothetical protein
LTLLGLIIGFTFAMAGRGFAHRKSAANTDHGPGCFRRE